MGPPAQAFRQFPGLIRYLIRRGHEVDIGSEPLSDSDVLFELLIREFRSRGLDFSDDKLSSMEADHIRLVSGFVMKYHVDTGKEP
jgi:hypothetical protein